MVQEKAVGIDIEALFQSLIAPTAHQSAERRQEKSNNDLDTDVPLLSSTVPSRASLHPTGENTDQ